jgi:hypothetical protein
MNEFEIGDFVKLKDNVELNLGGYIALPNTIYKILSIRSSYDYEGEFIYLDVSATSTITTTAPYFYSTDFYKYDIRKERKEKIEKLNSI